MKTKNFRCSCLTPSHCLFFDKDEDYIYVHMMLNHYLPFWERAKIAVKYLFKLPMSTNEHFDCICLSSEDVKELKDFLNEK